MKKLLISFCLIGSIGCAALTHPVTESERAKATRFCVGAEWVLHYTDLASALPCAQSTQYAMNDNVPWTVVACAAYKGSAILLRQYIDDVRDAVASGASDVVIAAKIEAAQVVYNNVEAVYTGKVSGYDE